MLHRANKLLVGAIVLCMAVMALGAAKKTSQLTFDNPVSLNGTVVKPGTYEVKVDFTANTMSLLKNGKTVAETPCRVTKEGEKAYQTRITSIEEGGTQVIQTVQFGGDDRLITIGS